MTASAAAPRVVLVTTGRYHHFDLARQFERRGLLEALYTGYPRCKLQAEELPERRIRTCPWLHVPMMAGAAGWLSRIAADEAAWHLDRVLLDRCASGARSHSRGAVIVAMSGHGSACGPRAQREGGAWICDRASTHVRHQEAVLRDEYLRWGIPRRPLPGFAVRREEFEYAHADRIALPSAQAERSFISSGVPKERLSLAPFGVDTRRFFPDGEPAPGEFRILFAGALCVRKGLGHLLEAFRLLRHPGKRLILAGTAGPEASELLRGAPEGVVLAGHCPQPQLRGMMSRSHAFVLPSVEEGLAYVMGQALACGCPVVATQATGAADLFEDGVEGFIIERADAADLAARLEELAQQPDRRRRMGEAALKRVRSMGGWNRYGDLMEALVRSVAGRGSAK